MGARTDAARAKVLARRAELTEELVRLEASGRAAVDVSARIRRAPAQTVGAAAGAAFLLLGGPGRLVRRVKRVVFGAGDELPRSMLPAEVDAVLRSLGSDGERVRSTIEREFARYLEDHSEARRERDLGSTAATVLANLVRPASARAGRQLAEKLFDPDGPGFADALAKARERRGRTGSNDG